jgi:hypothetical protein
MKREIFRITPPSHLKEKKKTISKLTPGVFDGNPQAYHVFLQL